MRVSLLFWGRSRAVVPRILMLVLICITALVSSIFLQPDPVTHATSRSAMFTNTTASVSVYLDHSAVHDSNACSTPTQDCPVIEYVNTGTYQAACQQEGDTISDVNYTNNWWTDLQTSDGKWGWVSNIYIKGGSQIAGVPVCDGNTTPPAPSSSSYTLTIENTDASLNNEVTQLQSLFAYSYPRLVERFGSATVAKSVTLTVDPNGTGISGTDAASAHITVNANYMKQHPDDLAWLTHELTHVVQNYQGSDVPGWFTTGMADYSRYYYAPVGSNPSWWTLPGNPSATDSYTAGFGVAARFLIWLQQHTSATIVDQLNHAAQTQQPFAATFQQITGGTVDQLWAQYKANPAIS